MNSSKPNMLEAALDYAEQGFKVFPCCWPTPEGKCGCGNKSESHQAGKSPVYKKGLIEHGLLDASSDPERIRKWWKQWPDANIGIPCSYENGSWVLDVDAKSDGLKSLEELERKHGKLTTQRVLTGGGGYHFRYKYPQDAKITTTKVYQGIETRADGAYVIVSPSLHVSGKRYIAENQGEIEDPPKWLVKMVTKEASEPAAEAEPGKLIPEGERNSTLTSLAGSMRRPGMTSEEIYAGLMEVNRLRCQPSLDEKEVRTIAESIAKHEPAVDVHRSDTGNATMLVKEYGDTLRYDHKRKRWLRWGKHQWETNYDGHISRLAQKIARVRQNRALAIKDIDIRKKELNWGMSSESRAKVDACVALAKIMEPITDEGKNWDTDPMLLGVPNGVVDLRNGELREGRPEDRITMSTGVDFNPNAKCLRWEKFLSEIFNNNEDLINWLWRSLGYSISGDMTEQIFLMGYGEGANGKSKFFEAISNTLGDYAYYTPFATFSLPAPSSTNDLAALERRRFVTSSETNIGTRLNIERIKAISGGDKITARYLYKEFEIDQPHLKLWLFMNHKPDIDDDTIATWRRVRLIPFTETFIKKAEDKHLGNKLKAEAEGILAWLVRGCLEWQKRSLTPVPEFIRAATIEYRKETDTIISFIADRCIKGEGEEIRARQLYSAYKTWAEGAVDKNKILSETKFGTQMGKRFEKYPDRRGVHYLGITLVDRGVYINMSGSD